MNAISEIGKTYLITTDNWFVAPDGKQYQAVYGTVNAILSDAETLGIKTNARSANWYVSIGRMLIAGCQVHYAIQCDNANADESESWSMDAANGPNVGKTPSRIYFAD